MFIGFFVFSIFLVPQLSVFCWFIFFSKSLPHTSPFEIHFDFIFLLFCCSLLVLFRVLLFWKKNHYLVQVVSCNKTVFFRNPCSQKCEKFVFFGFAYLFVFKCVSLKALFLSWFQRTLRQHMLIKKGHFGRFGSGPSRRLGSGPMLGQKQKGHLRPEPNRPFVNSFGQKNKKPSTICVWWKRRREMQN